MTDGDRYRAFVTDVQSSTRELSQRCKSLLNEMNAEQARALFAANPSADTGIPQSTPDLTLGDMALALFKARQGRSRIAPDHGLFADPAWDILLDLYVAHNDGKQVSVTNASLTTNVSQTTALRYVWHMESLSLIERRVDPGDKRRNFVMLSKSGLKLIEDILKIYIDQFATLAPSPNPA